MQIHRYPLTLLDVPADLRADPDGNWSYESLVAAAGLDPDALPPPIVAALYQPWRDHPEGAAVVASPGSGFISIVDCTAPSEVAAPPLERAPVAARRGRRSVRRAA